MVFFFYGKTGKQRDKAKKLFENLRAKKPDATFLTFDEENISSGILSELFEGQGLFEKKIVCFFNKVLKNKDAEKEILEKIPEFASSQNIFIWYEDELLKEIIKKIEVEAEKTDISDTKEEKKQNAEFDMFSLAEAFGKKDKKALWVLFQKAIKKDSAEAIHGILFWQLKSITLAKNTKTASEAEMKPFPYTKAKNFAKNFSAEEIKKMSSDLVSMYHDAHRGKVDFCIALERFVLGM